jgi:hypothetical protein
MANAFTDGLVQAAKSEVERALARLCADVGAAESSIMLPGDDAHLLFFASTNSALTSLEAPRVPINSSFSGLAYRTGQTIAVADAAHQAQHFEAVDTLVKSRTREFAAIPLIERSVLGVLTLVNRRDGAGESRPFTFAEIRRAEAFAKEAAHAFVALPGLRGAPARDDDFPRALGEEFVRDLAQLRDPERRIVDAVVDALIQNRVD